MIDLKELTKFLVKAKKTTYAAGDVSKMIINDDKSTTLGFEEGDWKYHDNYFGGEPFGGREAVFYKGSPVFMMTYYGSAYESIGDFDEVYNVLQGALINIPEDKPFRGPKNFKLGDFEYINKYEGKVDNFFGEEIIKLNGEEIYKTRYMGGLVDMRK